MGNEMKDMMARARKSDLARQRQIEAQKQSINRLLAARESEITDAQLIRQLDEGRQKDSVVIQGLQARIDAVWNLLRAEEGASQIRVDLIVAALSDA